MSFTPTQYIPAGLQGEPIFQKVAKLLEYVHNHYYVKDYETITKVYDMLFSEDIIQNMLSQLDTDQLTGLLSDSDRAEIVWFLQLFQRYKGTNRGLPYFFWLADIPGSKVFNKRYVDEQHQAGNTYFPDILPDCNIIVDVAIGRGHHLDLDAEDFLRIIFGKYLHFCIQIYEFRFTKIFRDYVDRPDSELPSQTKDHQQLTGVDPFAFSRHICPDVLVYGSKMVCNTYSDNCWYSGGIEYYDKKYLEYSDVTKVPPWINDRLRTLIFGDIEFHRFSETVLFDHFYYGEIVLNSDEFLSHVSPCITNNYLSSDTVINAPSTSNYLFDTGLIYSDRGFFDGQYKYHLADSVSRFYQSATQFFNTYIERPQDSIQFVDMDVDPIVDTIVRSWTVGDFQYNDEHIYGESYFEVPPISEDPGQLDQYVFDRLKEVGYTTETSSLAVRTDSASFNHFNFSKPPTFTPDDMLEPFFSEVSYSHFYFWLEGQGDLIYDPLKFDHFSYSIPLEPYAVYGSNIGIQPYGLVTTITNQEPIVTVYDYDVLDEVTSSETVELVTDYKFFNNYNEPTQHYNVLFGGSQTLYRTRIATPNLELSDNYLLQFLDDNNTLSMIGSTIQSDGSVDILTTRVLEGNVILAGNAPHEFVIDRLKLDTVVFDESDWVIDEGLNGTQYALSLSAEDFTKLFDSTPMIQVYDYTGRSVIVNYTITDDTDITVYSVNRFTGYLVALGPTHSGGSDTKLFSIDLLESEWSSIDDALRYEINLSDLGIIDDSELLIQFRSDEGSSIIPYYYVQDSTLIIISSRIINGHVSVVGNVENSDKILAFSYYEVTLNTEWVVFTFSTNELSHYGSPLLIDGVPNFSYSEEEYSLLHPQSLRYGNFTFSPSVVTNSSVDYTTNSYVESIVDIDTDRRASLLLYGFFSFTNDRVFDQSTIFNEFSYSSSEDIRITYLSDDVTYLYNYVSASSDTVVTCTYDYEIDTTVIEISENAQLVSDYRTDARSLFNSPSQYYNVLYNDEFTFDINRLSYYGTPYSFNEVVFSRDSYDQSHELYSIVNDQVSLYGNFTFSPSVVTSVLPDTIATEFISSIVDIDTDRRASSLLFNFFSFTAESTPGSDEITYLDPSVTYLYNYVAVSSTTIVTCLYEMDIVGELSGSQDIRVVSDYQLINNVPFNEPTQNFNVVYGGAEIGYRTTVTDLHVLPGSDYILQYIDDEGRSIIVGKDVDLNYDVSVYSTQLTTGRLLVVGDIDLYYPTEKNLVLVKYGFSSTDWVVTEDGYSLIVPRGTGIYDPVDYPIVQLLDSSNTLVVGSYVIDENLDITIHSTMPYDGNVVLLVPTLDNDFTTQRLTLALSEWVYNESLEYYESTVNLNDYDVVDYSKLIVQVQNAASTYITIQHQIIDDKLILRSSRPIEGSVIVICEVENPVRKLVIDTHIITIDSAWSVFTFSTNELSYYGNPYYFDEIVFSRDNYDQAHEFYSLLSDQSARYGNFSFSPSIIRSSLTNSSEDTNVYTDLPDESLITYGRSYFNQFNFMDVSAGTDLTTGLGVVIRDTVLYGESDVYKFSEEYSYGEFTYGEFVVRPEFQFISESDVPTHDNKFCYPQRFYTDGTFDPAIRIVNPIIWQTDKEVMVSLTS